LLSASFLGDSRSKCKSSAVNCLVRSPTLVLRLKQTVASIRLACSFFVGPTSSRILRTLAITRQQCALSREDRIAVAAQVYGDVRLLELSIMEVFQSHTTAQWLSLWLLWPGARNVESLSPIIIFARTSHIRSIIIFLNLSYKH
jgi:hypothetical protein